MDRYPEGSEVGPSRLMRSIWALGLAAELAVILVIGATVEAGVHPETGGLLRFGLEGRPLAREELGQHVGAAAEYPE